MRAATVVGGTDVHFRLASEVLVLPAFRGGVPCTRKELLAASPVSGLLVLEEWPTRGCRVARLRQAQGLRLPELLSPLFDPMLLRCDDFGALLRGFEYAGGERRVQAWWLRQGPASLPPAAER